MNKLLLPLLLLAGVLIWTGTCHPRNEVKTCFEGYTLSHNNLCVQDIDEEPHAACANGSLDGKGCRVEVPKVKRCPDGYTLDASNNCSYIATVGLQYFCPAGFYDDGNDCVMSTPGEVTHFCKPDAEMIGDQCVRLQKAEPIVTVTCPEDADLEDGTCWKTAETFDCHHHTCDKKVKGACPAEEAQPPPSNANLRMLLTGAGKEEQLVPVTPPKAFKVVVVSQSCAKKYEVPTVVQKTCPEGFSADGESCFLQEFLPLQSKCVATGGPADACPTIVKKSPKLARCPDGSLSVKGKCEQVVATEGVQYCPSGFVEKDELLCEGYIEAPLECSPDLLFKNGRCIGKRTHPPVVVNTEEKPEPIKKANVVLQDLHVTPVHHTKTKPKI